MCLRFALLPQACYQRLLLTSYKDSLTIFTCDALVRSSVGALRRMTSKTCLGVRDRLKSGETASSLIIRSKFTTHSKRCRVGDVNQAYHHHRGRHLQVLTFQHLISSLWTTVLAETS